MTSDDMSMCCSASHCHGCDGGGVSRRDLIASAATVTAGALFAPGLRGSARAADPVRQTPVKRPLRVQPVLAYRVPQKKEASSWREWGGILSEQDAAAEQDRIRRELAELTKTADFPIEFLPLATAQTPEQAAAISAGNHDGVINYAAGGNVKVMEALSPSDKWNLMFLRHRSGPAYLWYEIAHPRFLRKTVDEYGQDGFSVDDVVVDNHAEVLWRLRGLYGLKNTLGKRIVAVGGANGWGRGGRSAPDRSRELWKLDIQEVGYPELGERIKKARQDQQLVRKCQAESQEYLKQKGVSLETSRDFVTNAFLLTEVFRDLLDEAQTDAMTINSCMGTIMPMSETTACLPLSLLNDDGYMAFCESDFVVIPSGILLHYISGRPVFLNDPTYPHDNIVTLAHCTAPRKMDGKEADPVRILTHFESDYGAAPKVEMRKGMPVTNLIPDFASKKWVGFEGEVIDHPFMPICRSQIDVQIKGDMKKLLEEMKGFHWMTSYGNYLRESGYALKKVGVDWLAV